MFADVLHETLLAAYRRGGNPGVGQVHFLSSNGVGGIHATAAGAFRLPGDPRRPWLVPPPAGHCGLFPAAEGMSWGPADYGLQVSTGPLVWNPPPPDLRHRAGGGRHPRQRTED